MKLTKNINFDIVRFISALMIIAIHMYPFTCISKLVDYNLTRILFRICVPLFFSITGFFAMPRALKDTEYLCKYTIKITKIYLLSILLYLPINIYIGYFNDFSFIKIIKDILIDGTFYHLWYFPALILGIWLTYLFVKKIKNTKIIAVTLGVLYIIGLFGDNYYGLIANTPLTNIYSFIFKIFAYTRNGLFFAPIFIYMGYYFSNRENKVSISSNIIIIIALIALMLIEGNILYYYNIPRHSSMYLFLVPLVYFIFNLLTINKDIKNFLLSDIATLIYILHPLVIIIYSTGAKIVSLSILNNSIISYIIVSIGTILLSFIIVKIKNYRIVEKEYDKKLNLKI